MVLEGAIIRTRMSRRFTSTISDQRWASIVDGGPTSMQPCREVIRRVIVNKIIMLLTFFVVKFSLFPMLNSNILQLTLLTKEIKTIKGIYNFTWQEICF